MQYTLQPPEIWDGGVGFVSKEMIETQFPAPAADIKVLFEHHSPTLKPGFPAVIIFHSHGSQFIQVIELRLNGSYFDFG